MKSRNTLLLVASAIAAATLGGCAAYPYNDPYYNGQYNNNGPYYSEYRDPYYPGYYGPRYYGPPVTLGFGFSYSDHHHRYH